MNTKRARDLISYEFGTFDITKRDLINLEKIILKRVEPVHCLVTIGKSKGLTDESDIKYLSARYIKATSEIFHHATIKTTQPNIRIEFKPFSSTVTVQRIFSKDKSLANLDEIAQELHRYLLSKPQRKSGFLSKAKNRISLVGTQT